MMEEGRVQAGFKEGLSYIIDIREHDVPYLTRITIDYGTLSL